MKYIVTKEFMDVGAFRSVGDLIEADDRRAAKLRMYGLIGGIERAVIQGTENAKKIETLMENSKIYPESKQIKKKLEIEKKKVK